MSEWKVVPVEPTPEMIGAFWAVKNGHHYHDEPEPKDRSDYAAYRAMVAARPKLPGACLNEEVSLPSRPAPATRAEPVRAG